MVMSGEKRATDEPSWEFTVGLARGILIGLTIVSGKSRTRSRRQGVVGGFGVEGQSLGLVRTDQGEMCVCVFVSECVFICVRQ